MSRVDDLEIRNGRAVIRDVNGDYQRADRIRDCRFCRDRMYTIADGTRHDCFSGGDST
ncbi:hypothetical protein [Natrinema salinisoli]|uniref:hypothetical protein n=1 Tax=Natrinema salinisoli TaxID=2878535 RepID=UPI001CF0AEAC|nr:hypothetical protein [Natrinema salinisoli]